ncbi:MAG TPA: hypothetical protein VIC55_11880 [Gemmatimonadaceae bacterium]
MTIGEWLDTRTPSPPAELAVVLRGELGPALALDAALLGEESLAAAERLLARALATGCRERAQAVVLLAADALVTYAFEAAAEEPDKLGERAAAAVRRLSRLAVIVPPTAPSNGGAGRAAA